MREFRIERGIERSGEALEFEKTSAPVRQSRRFMESFSCFWRQRIFGSAAAIQCGRLREFEKGDGSGATEVERKTHFLATTPYFTKLVGKYFHEILTSSTGDNPASRQADINFSRLLKSPCNKVS